MKHELKINVHEDSLDKCEFVPQLTEQWNIVLCVTVCCIRLIH